MVCSSSIVSSTPEMRPRHGSARERQPVSKSFQWTYTQSGLTPPYRHPTLAYRLSPAPHYFLTEHMEQSFFTCCHPKQQHAAVSDSRKFMNFKGLGVRVSGRKLTEGRNNTVPWPHEGHRNELHPDPQDSPRLHAARLFTSTATVATPLNITWCLFRLHFTE